MSSVFIGSVNYCLDNDPTTDCFTQRENNPFLILELDPPAPVKEVTVTTCDDVDMEMNCQIGNMQVTVTNTSTVVGDMAKGKTE